MLITTEMMAKRIGVLRVFPGIEAGLENLGHGKGGKPRRKGQHRRRHGQRVRSAEGPVLKHRMQDGNRNRHQRNGRRDGEKQRKFKRPVLAVQGGLVVTGTKLARQVGQQHNANGNTDDPKRQLIKPVRVIEIGHRPVEARGNDGGDQQIDLHDPAGDDPGNGKGKHLFDIR